MSARHSYAADPSLGDAVFDLLDVVFPGIRAARARGEAFGARWESVSTPFVARDGERVVAHVGLMPLPLLVAGQWLEAGAVHAVATHPARRRAGLYRALLTELLAFAAGRHETLVLTTSHPEYFEPFGFRVVPEAIFRSRAGTPGRATAARLLDLRGSAADRALMRRLLETRAPVSGVLGVGPEKAGWAFYELDGAVRHLPDLDVAVVAERRGERLFLFDVVGPRVPRLPELLAGLGEPATEVVACFAPDRLGGPFEPEPHDLAGGPLALQPGEAGWFFMVRGPFAAEGRPLMLPRPARC